MNNETYARGRWAGYALIFLPLFVASFFGGRSVIAAATLAFVYGGHFIFADIGWLIRNHPRMAKRLAVGLLATYFSVLLIGSLLTVFSSPANQSTEGIWLFCRTLFFGYWMMPFAAALVILFLVRLRSDHPRAVRGRTR